MTGLVSLPAQPRGPQPLEGVPSDPTPSYRRRILSWSLLTLAASTVAVSGLTILILYHTAVRESEQQLTDYAEILGSLFNAIHRYESIEHSTSPQEAVELAMGHIREADRDYRGLGQTGGYVLGARQGENIVFVARRRHGADDRDRHLPWDSQWAEPMRRALMGQAGTVIGQDFRGALVLAAHRPLTELGLGLVVKQDMEEIRRPYLVAGLAALAGGLLLAGMGAFFLSRQTAPLLRSLEESEARFRLTFDKAPLGAAMVGPDLRFLRVNVELCRFLGYEPQELVGREVREIAHPDTWPGDVDEARQLLSGRLGHLQLERRFVRKDGQEVWGRINVRQVMDAQGRVLYALPLVEDISGRKQAEGEREEMISQLRQALDNVRTLKGLVPICASCKKIRNDKGYWQALESYLMQHTEADFSHGICPDCAQALFPDYMEPGEETRNP